MLDHEVLSSRVYSITSVADNDSLATLVQVLIDNAAAHFQCYDEDLTLIMSSKTLALLRTNATTKNHMCLKARVEGVVQSCFVGKYKRTPIASDAYVNKSRHTWNTLLDNVVGCTKL